MIGFVEQAVLVELSRAEIARRRLPNIWQGEFTRDLVCVSAIAGTFTIPSGFVTDGASIPPLLWNILSDTSPDILYPSFAHDLLYSVHGMKAIGAPAWKYDAVYRALHIFGGVAWGHHTPAHKLIATKTYGPHVLSVAKPFGRNPFRNPR